MYYIYFHINKTTREVFYVGKGLGKRAFVKSHRSKYWKRIVAKYGYEIEIIEENLTEEHAFERESFWIAKIGRKDLKKGTLINFTDGGDGSPKRIVDDKTRKAVALSNATRPKSDIQKQVVGSRYKGKFGKDHNRSKSVIVNETGQIFGSMSEASRILGIHVSSVHWSIKNSKPIFGMHFKLSA